MTSTQEDATRRGAGVRVLDLFSGGAGGWSLGLQRAGFTTVAACEIDPWRREVFATNHPVCRMYDDVRELSADRLIRDLGYLPDAVVGSPPCQEISAANSKGTGITDDHLFWEWARLVFEIRPLWCGAENSPRARSTGIDGIIAALAQAGYPSWPCVVGARHAGANHRRERLWLLAADAERFGVWQQSGRLGGARGAVAAVACEHDPDADGRLAPGAGRHADGRLGMGARANDGDLAHASSGRCDTRSRSDIAFAEPSGHAGDANGAGYPLGSSEPANDGSELPAALRAIGESWSHWNGGLSGLSASCAASGFGALDDGSTAILAPSLRNRAIAALGDAVVPQITEAIGRAVLKVAA